MYLSLLNPLLADFCRRNPMLQAELSPLGNCLIGIEVSGWPMLRLQIAAGSLQLVASGETDAHVRIQPEALRVLQQPHELTRLINAGQLRVEGDLRPVQVLAGLVRHWDVDLQTWLAHYFGNPVTGLGWQGAKRLHRRVHHWHRHFRHDLLALLRDERPVLADAFMVSVQKEQISALQIRLEQLEQRIGALQQRGDA